VSRDQYVRAVLALYGGLPHTAARRRPSPQDRRLAEQLFERQIPLDTITTACYLAIARRALRQPDAPPLAPIRSLAYFLPVLDEILLNPPEPGYIAYLRARLDQQVQFSTVLEDR
jgi:hypothetical protein